MNSIKTDFTSKLDSLGIIFGKIDENIMKIKHRIKKMNNKQKEDNYNSENSSDNPLEQSFDNIKTKIAKDKELRKNSFFRNNVTTTGIINEDIDGIQDFFARSHPPDYTYDLNKFYSITKFQSNDGIINTNLLDRKSLKLLLETLNSIEQTLTNNGIKERHIFEQILDIRTNATERIEQLQSQTTLSPEEIFRQNYIPSTRTKNIFSEPNNLNPLKAGNENTDSDNNSSPSRPGREIPIPNISQQNNKTQPSANTNLLNSMTDFFSNINRTLNQRSNTGSIIKSFPETFNGNTGKAIEWLREFETIAGSNMWNNDQKVRYAREKLKDSAKNWFNVTFCPNGLDNDNTIPDWDTFKERFLMKYKSKNYEELVRTKISGNQEIN